MMKKTMIALAALAAITAGASTLGANKAEAGVSVNIGFGGYGGYYGGYFGPKCYTKYKAIKIKKWGYYGWYWKTIWKPYTVCY